MARVADGGGWVPRPRDAPEEEPLSRAELQRRLSEGPTAPYTLPPPTEVPAPMRRPAAPAPSRPEALGEWSPFGRRRPSVQPSVAAPRFTPWLPTALRGQRVEEERPGLGRWARRVFEPPEALRTVGEDWRQRMQAARDVREAPPRPGPLEAAYPPEERLSMLQMMPPNLDVEYDRADLARLADTLLPSAEYEQQARVTQLLAESDAAEVVRWGAKMVFWEIGAELLYEIPKLLERPLYMYVEGMKQKFGVDLTGRQFRGIGANVHFGLAAALVASSLLEEHLDVEDAFGKSVTMEDLADFWQEGEIGYTFLLHPERAEEFREDIRQGMPVVETTKKYEAFWTELGLNTVLDPLNLLAPAAASKLMEVLWPGGTWIFRGGQKAAGLAWSKTIGRLPVGKWLTQLSDRTLVTLAANEAIDTANQLVGRSSLDVGPVEVLDRAMAGDLRGLEGVLSEGTVGTWDRIANGLAEDGIGSVQDLVARYMPAIGKNWDDEVLQRALAERPHLVAWLFGQSVERRQALEMGVRTFAEQGAIPRTFEFAAAILKEQWLSTNPAYMWANLMDNTMKAWLYGHFVNPFSVNADRRIGRYMEEFGAYTPQRVREGLVQEAVGLEVPSRMAKVPIPGIGKPSEVIDYWSKAFGVDLRKRFPLLDAIHLDRPTAEERLLGLVDDVPTGAAILDKLNWASLTEAGRNISGNVERIARVQVFYDVFRQHMEGVVRPQVVEKAIDQGLPEYFTRLIGNPNRVKSPADIMRLADDLMGPGAPMARLSSLMPDPSPEHEMLRLMADALDDVQRELMGENEPVLLRRAKDLFDVAAGHMDRTLAVGEYEEVVGAWRAEMVRTQAEDLLGRTRTLTDELLQSTRTFVDGNPSRAGAAWRRYFDAKGSLWDAVHDDVARMVREQSPDISDDVLKQLDRWEFVTGVPGFEDLNYDDWGVFGERLARLRDRVDVNRQSAWQAFLDGPLTQERLDVLDTAWDDVAKLWDETAELVRTFRAGYLEQGHKAMDKTVFQARMDRLWVEEGFRPVTERLQKAVLDLLPEEDARVAQEAASTLEEALQRVTGREVEPAAAIWDWTRAPEVEWCEEVETLARGVRGYRVSSADPGDWKDVTTALYLPADQKLIAAKGSAAHDTILAQQMGGEWPETWPHHVRIWEPYRPWEDFGFETPLGPKEFAFTPIVEGLNLSDPKDLAEAVTMVRDAAARLLHDLPPGEEFAFSAPSEFMRGAWMGGFETRPAQEFVDELSRRIDQLRPSYRPMPGAPQMSIMVKRPLPEGMTDEEQMLRRIFIESTEMFEVSDVEDFRDVFTALGYLQAGQWEKVDWDTVPKAVYARGRLVMDQTPEAHHADIIASAWGVTDPREATRWPHVRMFWDDDDEAWILQVYGERMSRENLNPPREMYDALVALRKAGAPGDMRVAWWGRTGEVPMEMPLDEAIERQLDLIKEDVWNRVITGQASLRQFREMFMPLQQEAQALFQWEQGRQARNDALRETQGVLQAMSGWWQNIQQEVRHALREKEYVAAEHEGLRMALKPVAEMWANGLDDALTAGSLETKRVFFDYTINQNWEELMRYAVPFSKWQIHNPFLWRQTLTRRPQVFGLLKRFTRATEEVRQREHLTQRFSGAVPLPGARLWQQIGLLPEGYWAMDPSSLLSVTTQMRQPWTSPEEEEVEGVLGAVGALSRLPEYAGMSLWPWLEQGLSVLGAQAAPSWGLTGPFGRVFPEVARGEEEVSQRVTEGIRGLFGAEGRIDAKEWLDRYWTYQTLAAWANEGAITEEQMNRAMADPEDDLFKAAAAEHQRIANIQSRVRWIQPFGLKYARPGEMALREEREAIYEMPEERAAFMRGQVPGLGGYSTALSAATNPEYAQWKAQRDLINTRYDAMLERLPPWHPRVSEINRARMEEIDALGPAPATYGGKGYELAPDSREGVLFALEQGRPRAQDFADEAGTVDWDAYNAMTQEYESEIEERSGEMGFPVTLDDYRAFRNRYLSPAELAWEGQEGRIGEAWDEYSRWKAQGAFPAFGLPRAGDEEFNAWLNQEFQRRMEAGWQAPELFGWAGQQARVPFDVERERMQEMAPPTTPEAYREEILRQRPWLAGQPEAAREWGDWQRWAGEQMPGVMQEFEPAEQAKQQMRDWFYGLMPRQRRAATEQLGMEEGADFEEWLETQAWGGGPTGRMGFVQPIAGITAPTETEELQLERDMYQWSQKDGEWTDLLNQFYGHPESAPSRFWERVGSMILSDSAYDDPVLGPVLSKDFRDRYDLPEEVYEEALRYLDENETELVNEELMRLAKAHPEWWDLAQEQAAEVRAWVGPEALQDQYAALTTPGERSTWKEENQEAWAQLTAAWDERNALLIANPHYMFFHSPDKFKRWFGEDVSPDDIDIETELAAYKDAEADLREAEVTGAQWSEDMERWFGDPDSPSSQFWNYYFSVKNYLSDDMYDDPVVMAALASDVRSLISYESQAPLFREALSRLRGYYDPTEAARWAKYPDLQREAGEQYREFQGIFDYDARPQGGDAEDAWWDDRRAWQQAHPVMTWFYYPEQYVKWWGESPPIEATPIHPVQPSEEKGGGGGGGGGGGDGGPPPPPPPPPGETGWLPGQRASGWV